MISIFARCSGGFKDHQEKSGASMSHGTLGQAPGCSGFWDLTPSGRSDRNRSVTQCGWLYRERLSRRQASEGSSEDPAPKPRTLARLAALPAPQNNRDSTATGPTLCEAGARS
jgi:hypothetical protein